MATRKALVAATIWLMVGYGIGQGSSLLLQIVLRHQVSAQQVGVAFLYLSIFSLCFQFADLGNSTYSNRHVLNLEFQKYYRFIGGRAIFSVPVTFVAAYFCLPPDISSDLRLQMLYILPIGAFLFGLSEISRVESEGQYRIFAVLQAVPWVTTAFLIWLAFDLRLISVEVLAYVWLVIPLIYLAVTRSNPVKILTSISIKEIKEVFAPLAFLLPTLIAQIWGRYMLIVIANLGTIALIGPIGIVRSVHTAGCMMLGFLIRPLVLKYISEKSNGNLNDVVFSPVKVLIWPILGLFIFTAILCFVPLGLPHDIAYWLPILVGIPVWGISSIFTLQNQLKMKAVDFAKIDVVGIVAHAIGFMSLVYSHPAWAFVLADVARLLIIMLGRNFSRDRRIFSK